MKLPHVLRRPLLAIGLVGLIASLVSLLGVWAFGVHQLTVTLKAGIAIAYFSFLLQCYLDRKPIKVRDGSSVSPTANPILYRAIYAFFVVFGAAWAAIIFL
ncbi:hypothetical protein [Variovorax sp. Sphag1AA]|uniref:hypothetical protein n=1 Tax=Variovorax sp. Sphag1AA TaxID=2587027 RepID=UPI0016166E63|nr:hypothetical protein [Variovorax sp. Sphag1AA]MBB3175647.1 hypothetical protein [Variovorax sp. Sphag1AA]